jgi:two-component system, cell cycle sensor histidine kinase and response regulator CckA
MPRRLQLLFAGNAAPGPSLAAELSRGGFDPEFTFAATPEDLARRLSSKWDLAIGNFEPGRFGAFDLLRAVGEGNIDLPVIVVSRRVKDSYVTELLKEGAADHIILSNLMRLNAAVERELRAAALRKERTQLEEQFRQAQKMEAVGRLAGGVAHDFNNLLTVITGYSDLLLNRAGLNDNQKTALEEIRRAAERGGALTHQLLAFSRRQPLQLRSVQVNELIMQLQKLLRRLIGEDISLEILPGAPMDTVEADPGRIEQVVMNLAVNARDAMPGGGILTIETSNIEVSPQYLAQHLGVAPGHYLMLSIADTGHGMDAETLSHLFEPFFTTKTPGRGTGLGLATAYGIIRQSGGAIQFASEPGKGTTAFIYLPLTARTEPGISAEKEMAEQRGVETILVVEDEARVRKLICSVLGIRGYRILEAARGEEAIRTAAEHDGPIHLLLVDVIMPGMSGPEVVRDIQVFRPGTQVLYISGYTEEAIVHHGIPASGVPFLPKPFLPNVLSRKVREILDNCQGTTPGS